MGTLIEFCSYMFDLKGEMCDWGRLCETRALLSAEIQFEECDFPRDCERCAAPCSLLALAIRFFFKPKSLALIGKFGCRFSMVFITFWGLGDVSVYELG